MYYVNLAHHVDFYTWHLCVRELLQHHIAPKDVCWRVVSDADVGLFQESHDNPIDLQTKARSPLSRHIYQHLQFAIQNCSPDRFDVMYKAVLEHVTQNGGNSINDLEKLAKDVVSETKKFRDALVQRLSCLKEVEFFELDNYLLEANAHFCVELHPAPFQIDTHYRSIRWGNGRLFFGVHDKNETINWYEIGKFPWVNLPRTSLPPDLQTVRDSISLDDLQAQSMDCRQCELFKQAQRTVFGEGNQHASIMFVGEQPGDQEDRQGHPFVGPAGEIFDQALKENLIKREDVYITNAVKHFRYQWRGERRLHQKPLPIHIDRCRVWLQEQCRKIKPKLIFLLGGTAAQSVLHKPVSVLRERGKIFDLGKNIKAIITVHPSYILRQSSEENKKNAYAHFKEDIGLAKDFLAREKIGS